MACVTRSVNPSSSCITPYLERLDAHDRGRERGGRHGPGTNRPSSSNGGGDTGDGDGAGEDLDDDGKSVSSPKRPLFSDIDDDGPRVKRSKVDSAEFVWCSRAKELLDSMVLTPERLAVQQRVKIHSRDPKAAVPDLLNSFRAPALPESQWRNVLLDRFVDLDSIVTNSYAVEAEEPQQLVVRDSYLEVEKPRTVSRIFHSCPRTLSVFEVMREKQMTEAALKIRRNGGTVYGQRRGTPRSAEQVLH